MRDPNYLLVGGQADEDKSDDEIECEQDTEDRERAEFIEAWKAMYRRKGLGPNNYHIDWGTVFEDERIESLFPCGHQPELLCPESSQPEFPDPC